MNEVLGGPDGVGNADVRTERPSQAKITEQKLGLELRSIYEESASTGESLLEQVETAKMLILEKGYSKDKALEMVKLDISQLSPEQKTAIEFIWRKRQLKLIARVIKDLKKPRQKEIAKARFEQLLAWLLWKGVSPDMIIEEIALELAATDTDKYIQQKDSRTAEIETIYELERRGSENYPIHEKDVSVCVNNLQRARLLLNNGVSVEEVMKKTGLSKDAILVFLTSESPESKTK